MTLTTTVTGPLLVLYFFVLATVVLIIMIILSTLEHKKRRRYQKELNEIEQIIQKHKGFDVEKLREHIDNIKQLDKYARAEINNDGSKVVTAFLVNDFNKSRELGVRYKKKLVSEFITINLTLANIAHESKQYPVAEKLLMEVLYLDPDNSVALHNYLATLAAQNRKQEAYLFLKSHYESIRTPRIFIELLEFASQYKGLREVEKAFNKDRNRFASDARVLTAMGGIYNNKEKGSKAETLIKHAAKLEKNNPWILYELGKSTFLLKKYDETKVILNRALANLPSGESEFCRQCYAIHRVSKKRANECSVDSPRRNIHRVLCEVNHELGDYPSMKENAEAILKLEAHCPGCVSFANIILALFEFEMKNHVEARRLVVNARQIDLKTVEDFIREEKNKLKDFVNFMKSIK